MTGSRTDARCSPKPGSFSRRDALSACLGLALWPVASLAQEAAALPSSVRSRIQRLTPAREGREMTVRVELSWPGRPELLLPQVPSLTVPEGAAVRLGRTGSSFQGNKTRWWTDLVVTLPELPGPWAIGPASVEVVDPAQGGARISHEVPARRFRPSRRRNLLGQGVGSTIVLLLAGAWGVHLWRTVGGDDPRRSDEKLAAAVAAAEAAVVGPPEPFLVALLELRAALPEAAGDLQGLPSAAELEALLDAVRFGGQSLPAGRRRTLLAPIAASAGASSPKREDSTA